MIEIGADTIPVRAIESTGPERDEVFARQVARFPIFAENEHKTGRNIPVILLERRAV